MTNIFRIAASFCLAASLMGCQSLPRGAGLESEVLRTAGERDGAEEPDFEVAPVTRDLLPVYAAWPTAGAAPLPWLDHVEQPANRIIAPGDSVTVTIWSAEESSLLTTPGQRFVNMPEMRVSSSGMIFLPYIGSIRVAGMSPEHAREEIETHYLDVSPSAQVQFALAEGQGNAVSMVNGVANPGMLPLPDSSTTLTAMLSLAGGVRSNMRNPQVRLLRGGETYGISVNRLLSEPRFDTTLRGGDRIVVVDEDRYFLSLGAAGTEAEHVFPRDEVTALEAMSIIGGVSDSRADPQGILVLREYPESAVGPNGPPQTRMVFTIDLTTADGLFSAGTFQIQTGDLVYATESPATAVQEIFVLIGNAFGLATRVNSVAG